MPVLGSQSSPAHAPTPQLSHPNLARLKLLQKLTLPRLVSKKHAAWSELPLQLQDTVVFLLVKSSVRHELPLL